MSGARFVRLLNRAFIMLWAAWVFVKVCHVGIPFGVLFIRVPYYFVSQNGTLI